MAKRTLRIDLPANKPDKFIKLMKDVVANHEALGASSPLNNPSIIDMADFKAKLLKADTLRRESIEARAEAEAKMMESKQILGIGVGQNMNSDKHLYFMLDGIKHLLLAMHRDNPEHLSTYGFNVVIGTAKGIGRPKKKKE